MVKVYLSLGSNLGDRRQHIRRAVELIDERDSRVAGCSSLIETEPWGFESANRFLNAAVAIETTLAPLDLLLLTQEIERELGRTNKSVDGAYHDRTIDIDILLYGHERISDPRLVVPHPRLLERDFVVKPLTELMGLTAEELAQLLA